MRSLILYVPDGVTLDLEQPDLGHPDGHEIVRRHHRQGTRKSMGFGRANPAFACLAHIGTTNPGLFLKQIGGEWWAAHYERGECSDRRIPMPMSDEHKRQTEYWVRAAQGAGWSVDTEHSLPTGTRPDALIFGPVLTGIEVQRSSMTASSASARTRKALAAGVTDIWYTGNDIKYAEGKLTPPWAHRVPTVGSPPFPWTHLPAQRSAQATGMRRVQALDCTYKRWPLCPETRRRPCGKWHAIPSPLHGLTVDDVAARFPAGELVALRFRKNSRSGDVFLVPAESATIYEELTGYRAPAPIAPVPKTGEKPGRVECASPQTLLPLYVPPTAAERIRTTYRNTSGLCEDGIACNGTAQPDGDWMFCQACRMVRLQGGARWLARTVAVRSAASPSSAGATHAMSGGATTAGPRTGRRRRVSSAPDASRITRGCAGRASPAGRPSCGWGSAIAPPSVTTPT